ncbi:SDR family oxidoreductase [Cystobacter fuscus]|uniref:SDR family oxidoreductase n=1 Tax=Cystobacter fuscus TaxID=43 RepID=UPI002B2976D4|nr:SDR family oxidoreductase [Cystobacter fuscus]
MAQKDPRSAGNTPPQPPQEQSAPALESKMTPEPDYGLTSYKGLGRLKGRVALVTGGDSGIGRAVCLAFAREGADVAFGYLNEDQDAEVTRRAVEESGHQVVSFRGDLTDEAVCRRLIEDTVKRFGRIDILVNNAAYQGKAVEKFEEISAERLERTFRTNILAMFHLVRYALPHMKKGSTIINTASIQAYQPTPSILDYACTKGAIVTFTKGLAQELIERGIRVNCVAPGPVWTPIIPASFDAEKVKSFGEDNPTGRAGQPVELAPSYVFLASDESTYVNGEVLGVTGGKLLA